MCECGLTATIVASAALILVVAYLVVATFIFCEFDSNNFIRQLYGIEPMPERRMRTAALTWPLWVWRVREDSL